MNEQYLIICDDRPKNYFSQAPKSEEFKFVVSETEFEIIYYFVPKLIDMPTS